MQNKNVFQGFIPVNGNWDLPAREGCARNRSGACQTCQNCGNPVSSCRCARKDGGCAVESCAANGYVRDGAQTAYAVRTGDSCACNPRQTAAQEDCACTARKTCPCQEEAACANAPRKACECQGECACNGQKAACACAAARTAAPCERNPRNGANAYPAAGYARNTALRNRGVGMVNGVEQEIGEIYRNESALRAGTLFPELHKPMNGYCPYDENCGTPCQAAAFAAWELRLYLDTHPGDRQALAMLENIENQLADPNYATTFLPEGSDQNWTWVNDPWPRNFDCK